MARRHHRYREHHHYNNYHPHQTQRRLRIPKVKTLITIILFAGLIYLLLFNPKLPSIVFKFLSPVVYILEIAFLIIGLITLNQIRVGSSDLSVWGMGILGIFLMVSGAIYYFAASFAPPPYNYYNFWLAVIFVIFGAFAMFRSSRRYGQFIYLR